MATASRNMSPGAALLRASRLFSMPQPIPPPPGDFSQATKHKSETATAAFPTHLSVTTPQSFRMVGDWGFKRPLPLKKTTKQTLPLVRVRQVDSIEQVTDFKSASDHSITVEKVQEMGVHFTVPPFPDASTAGVFYPPWKSVFEADGDITALKPGEAEKTEKKRWKFKGRWLAGMTDGEFESYLNTVRRRRAGFNAFLKERLAAEMTEDKNKAAREKPGQELAPAIRVQPHDITEAQFSDYLRSLRHDLPTLYRLVGRFLDLAPIELQEQLKKLGSFYPGRAYNIERDSPYAAGGPPITHPSAGLSYLRTSNYMDNHPIYGPQKHHSPVKARVLLPRHSAPGFRPVLGVGGLVTNIQNTVFNQRDSNEPSGLHTFEPNTAGGTKVYVYPEAAHVDSTGKVHLRLNYDTNETSTVVHREMVGEGDVYDDEARRAKLPPTPYYRPRSPLHVRSNRFGSAKNYGLDHRSF